MTKNNLIPDEVILSKIYLIRGQKVMLDSDLAVLFEVSTGNLNKAVKRNLRRFPDDFMFQLTKEEFKNLIFQIGTSRWGGTRKMPNAFSEQGVTMLACILNSDIAIDVNIRIIRIFIKMREMLLTHKDILIKLEQMERQVVQNNDEIQHIFNILKQLLNPPQEPRKRIGFKTPGQEEN